MNKDPKAKLTITVDERVLAQAKRAAEEKHIALSALIENFLAFFVDPWVYCIKCGDKFSSSEANLCVKCGWMKCPKCAACGCGMNERAAEAMHNMRRTYEDLLSGRVKP